MSVPSSTPAALRLLPASRLNTFCVSRRVLPGTKQTMNDEPMEDDNAHIDTDAMTNDAMANGVLGNDAMDGLPDGDRQLTTDSAAIDESSGGGNNDSDLGADVAGDIGPKHA